MTQSKREPFSVILLEYSDAGGQTYSVEVFGTKIAGNFGLDGSNRKCAELNAAFNARVDEEIELVRLKTIRMCADKADRMGSEEIRNAILFETLPTELEGK